MQGRHSQALVASSMTAIPLTYPANPVALFAALRANYPQAVWLDGAADQSTSIMAAAPREQIISRGGQTYLGCGRALGGADPLALVAQRLGPIRPTLAPFGGGAIGYFSYELGRRLQGQPLRRTQSPEMWVGLYDWAIVLNHSAQSAWLAGDAPASVLRWLAHAPSASLGEWQALSAVSARPNNADYQHAFARVQSYLKAGDCYQINLARQFRAAFAGDPLAVYADFRSLAGGPFSAYLETPDGAVLSGSPERFLSLREGQIATHPIKGTRARQADAQADHAVRAELQASPKDRAENVMIVDLLRNDLGRSAQTGSVRVPQLCALESFPTVHHMVSVVTGELAPGRHATDLLRDCLPGGSITGAPKFRAMEIIDTLEAQPRGVYCGAIGYIGYDGAMDTNIAIRTMTAVDGWLDYRAGGGIVVDSVGEAEFAETESKAAAFRQLVDNANAKVAAKQQTLGAD